MVFRRLDGLNLPAGGGEGVAHGDRSGSCELVGWCLGGHWERAGVSE